MNVGIDITSLIYDRGVSRYTANLVRSLLEQNSIDLSLYGASYRQHAELLRAAQKLQQQHKTNIVIQKYPPTLQTLLWNQLHLNPIRSIFPKIDVFHSWDWLQPPDHDVPLVSTIHDIAILKYPETAHPKIARMHQRSWQILKERGAEIIAVSQATKKDIVQLLGIPADKVHVIYEALPHETIEAISRLSEEEYEVIKSQLHVEKPYILFTGTREPRKNLRRLIEAWQPLAGDIDLIVAGEAGWDEVADNRVRFLGRVTNQQLVVLYSEAEAFVYPSLYEGFGLPILEAFSFGTPVVTSNVSSMPEVAGNAAQLVDPLSVESIRQGIATLLHETHEEQQLRLKKMIIRLQLFDWTRVAEETIHVYQKAYEHRS